MCVKSIQLLRHEMKTSIILGARQNLNRFMSIEMSTNGFAFSNHLGYHVGTRLIKGDENFTFSINGEFNQTSLSRKSKGEREICL